MMDEKDASKIVNLAVSKGIGRIVKEHPKFNNYKELIMKYLDDGKLNDKFNEINEKLRGEKISFKDARKYLQEEITNYVAGGFAFNEKGKQIILKKGLEEKVSTNFFSKLFSGKKSSKGVDYLNKSLGAFQDLYLMFKKEGHDKNMPEIKKPLATMNNLGFLDPAVDILKAYGLMGNKEYQNLKNDIYTQAEESTTVLKREIGNKIQSYKVAAGIFIGILGIFVVLYSNITMTGNIVASVSSPAKNLIGGFLILISLMLFMKRPKIKTKIKNV